MLFFIFIALFAISVLAIIYTDEMSGWHLLATIAVVLTLIALLIITIGLASVYIGADASVAKWETHYESLTYQLENNLYDNDNDIGKKELMDEIRDYIDGEKFINEIPCDSEGRELATLNQNASKANDNW